MDDMISPEGQGREGDPSGSLYGWDLGMVAPGRAPPAAFLPGKAQCAICGRGITDREAHLFQSCDFWRCREERRRQQRALWKEREQRERRWREEFRKRLRLLRDEAAGLLGIDRPERFEPAVVPAVERPVTGLPPERRSALGDHLVQLTAEAIHRRRASPGGRRDDGAPAAPPDAESGPTPILQRACAMCQGHCCVAGGSRGYLEVDTILRYLDEHPQLEAPEVVASFLSHVQQSTYEDSCVYHGEHGCTLPRRRRSATCNGFECAEFRRLQEEFSSPGPHRVFLVAVQGSRVVRYAFVDV